MRNYKFNGWQESSDVTPITDRFAWLLSPLDLYDALSASGWCEQTCAPRLRSQYSENNKTCGQCSITAFLVQDLFGGDVYGIMTEGGNMHCYNVIDDSCFDLTSEQFGEKAGSLVYDKKTLQSREQHFAKTEKYERYQLLCSRIEKYDGFRLISEQN